MSHPTPITEDEVNAAQQAWSDALIRIGAVHAEGGDFRTAASALLTSRELRRHSYCTRPQAVL